MSEKRFYFDADDDGHDYLVPLELRELFRQMLKNCWDKKGGMDYDAIEDFEDKFGDMRTGMSTSLYSFTDPKSEL